MSLNFDSESKDENLAQFAQFHAYRDVLGREKGSELDFDEMAGSRACRIRIDRPEGGNIDNDPPTTTTSTGSSTRWAPSAPPPSTCLR